MVERKISPYNTRLFKHADGKFELRLASANTSRPAAVHDFTCKSGVASITVPQTADVCPLSQFVGDVRRSLVVHGGRGARDASRTTARRQPHARQNGRLSLFGFSVLT